MRDDKFELNDRNELQVVLFLTLLVGFAFIAWLVYTRWIQPVKLIPRPVETTPTPARSTPPAKTGHYVLTADSTAFTSNNAKVQAVWIGMRVKVTGRVDSVIITSDFGGNDVLTLTLGNKSVVCNMAHVLDKDEFTNYQRTGATVTIIGAIQLPSENQIWLNGCRLAD